MNINEYSPLVLAYVGDAYFELLVRDRITAGGDADVSKMSSAAKAYVTAVSQSDAVERVIPALTEDEEAVYKRGRNAKSAHSPKSAAVVQYRRATGLECLFGWLHLCGNEARAKELFEIAFPSVKPGENGNVNENEGSEV